MQARLLTLDNHGWILGIVHHDWGSSVQDPGLPSPSNMSMMRNHHRQYSPQTVSQVAVVWKYSFHHYSAVYDTESDAFRKIVQNHWHISYSSNGRRGHGQAQIVANQRSKFKSVFARKLHLRLASKSLGSFLTNLCLSCWWLFVSFPSFHCLDSYQNLCF